MARCRTGSLCALWAQVKSRSIARRCRLFAPRIPSSRCLLPLAGHTSSCVLFSYTICPSKLPTNEAPASADCGQPSPCSLCAHFHFRSCAAPPVSMNPKNSQPFLVAIVGPTASGKSALGVWLAERLGGEVIACDSTQLYRGFDVGTAKPNAEERSGVPHHLIDVLGPREEATAGGYRESAIAVLEDLRARKKQPIFTVGTGLYLRVLLEGLADVPLRS